MKAEVCLVPARERIPGRERLPAALFRHPAWVAWKETQGWRRVGELDGRPVLVRDLTPRSSMAYVLGPALGGDEDDRGGRLEALSLRARPLLPSDCAFIRWDLLDAPWRGAEGAPLDTRLIELRMNASTLERRLRKAAVEPLCPDTMVVDLRGGWPAVAGRMEHRARYSAQLAERRGTRVEKAGEAGLGDFHALFRKTASLRGLKLHDEACYRELFRTARETGLTLDLYLATAAGTPVASAVFARHRREAWYLFAASDPACRRWAGPSAILHRALRECAEAGDERIDLLGVAPAGMTSHPLAGLSLFKASFGGVRKSRAGAWDFVLDPEVYEAYARAEAIALP